MFIFGHREKAPTEEEIAMWTSGDVMKAQDCYTCFFADDDLDCQYMSSIPPSGKGPCGAYESRSV